MWNEFMVSFSFFRARFCLRVVLVLLGGAVSAGGVTSVGVTSAMAQNVQRIAAVVNDDVITEFDLLERMNLIITSSGLPHSDEVRQNLLPRVLRMLVDERLKEQEIRRQGIVVEASEIEDAKRQIERNNKFPEGSLETILRKDGISPKVLEKQLHAEIGWIRVAQDLRRQVSVEPQEIDAILDSLRETLGKPQRLLAEIVLMVDDPNDDEKIKTLGNDLVRQIRQGGSFPALAQQFSSVSTAAVGGDLGWVPEGQLEPEVEAVVKSLRPGEMSAPIRTSSGYVIVLVRDIQTPQAPDMEALPVALSQLYMPTEGVAAVSEDIRAKLTETMTQTAKGCDDVERIAAGAKLPGSGFMGEIRLNDLPPEIRSVARTLPENTPSPLITLPGAEVVVMVCRRADVSGLPSRDQIEQRIGQDKLERAAMRKLRDLRRVALIDIRL